jgi:serine/threonine protein kinase
MNSIKKVEPRSLIADFMCMHCVQIHILKQGHELRPTVQLPWLCTPCRYRKKHLRHISDMAIKRWAFQILEGLLYLHAHSPPIVHRDLKVCRMFTSG